MSKPLKIPAEQRSFDAMGDQGLQMHGDRRDLQTGIQSPDPGDDDVNLDEQGRFGNLKQNLTTQWKVQNR